MDGLLFPPPLPDDATFRILPVKHLTMDSEPEEDAPGFNLDIPEVFYSSETGRLLDHCIVCDKYLLEENTRYMVEKVYKKYPALNTESVLFEYAICATCADNFRKELSQESMQNIENFFRNNTEGMPGMATHPEDMINPGRRLDNCFVSGKSVDNLNEYQVCGIFQGKKMIPFSTPYVISGEVIEQLSDLISDKTRDEMDDFIDSFFGLPPEWKEAMKDRDIVLI